MKKTIILLVTGLLIINFSQGVAQELLISGEPGYGIYLDDKFQGFVSYYSNPYKSDPSGKLKIHDVDTGRHRLGIKSGDGSIEKHSIYIKDTINDFTFSSDTYDPVFPRSDGYYVGVYEEVEKSSLFRGDYTSQACIVLYAQVNHDGSGVFAWTIRRRNTLSDGWKDSFAKIYRNSFFEYNDDDKYSFFRDDGIHPADVTYKDDDVWWILHRIYDREYDGRFRSYSIKSVRFNWFGEIDEDGLAFSATVHQPSDEMALLQYFELGFDNADNRRVSRGLAEKAEFEFVPVSPSRR
ncbi:hypothetical protein KY327_00310 [Candidatus Woesearchaeota archaeon]|nr:hypothetical protein [Candidatus Woesearchaeota archaeon]